MRGLSGQAVADRVRAAFAAHTGTSAMRLFFAPGRINLIGAHLDYNGGDVLPLAVDRGIYVAARARDDGLVRLRSLDQELAVEIAADAIAATKDEAHGWASYPLGVLRAFALLTGERIGVDLVFGGDVPMASGLSSSAALEVATATAIDALHDTRLEAVALARLAHEAETEYVGLQCGIMDQFASALGKPGHAMLLHCRTQEVEHVPLAREAFEILMMDSRKPRTLASTGFNARVAECRQAFAALRAAGVDRPCLAACTTGDLERAGGDLPALLLRRARHVVSEMERVAVAVAALRQGDIRGFGACLDASHRSTATDYDVSCPELDAITAAARACPDVFGARLTGAGFGGCAIALVAPGRSEAVAAAVAARYAASFGMEPGFGILKSGPGRREVT